MSSSPDTLLFRFTTHADSILNKMNTLREELRFCDVTLLIGGPQGTTAQPLYFHGHRVVFAASSDFLRDQFLLHEGHAELSVGIVSSVEVGRRLLLSCYTGLLEVPLRELVSYLTAASALQMTQVAEKCAQAVSQYLSPTLAFLKLNPPSEKGEIQQTDSSRSGACLKNEEERDAAQPGTSNQKANTEECESKPKVSQQPMVDIKGRNGGTDERRNILATIELSEGVVCCFNTLESEEGEEIQPDYKVKPTYQADDITDDPKCRLHPFTAVQTCISSKTGGSSAKCEELLVSSKKQDEVREEKSEEEEEEMLVERPYLCRRCDRVFQDLESYLGHLKEHRRYLCLVCGKGFSQKSNLTRHIHVHTGVKLFRCPLCHKTFSHKATLQDHLNLHTGDPPHKCHYCAVHFAHKLGLRRHIKGLHGKNSLKNIIEETVD